MLCNLAYLSFHETMGWYDVEHFHKVKIASLKHLTLLTAVWRNVWTIACLTDGGSLLG